MGKSMGGDTSVVAPRLAGAGIGKIAKKQVLAVGRTALGV
jgi:hypothetical protein